MTKTISTPQEEQLFKLLQKAYVDARYNKDYRITKEELEYLANCVQKLKALTEELCKEHIENIDKLGSTQI